MYTTMHSYYGSSRPLPKMSIIRSVVKGLFYCVFIFQATESAKTKSGKVESHDQVRLVDDLMETYNKYVRPVKNSSTVVIVDFQFFFSTVLDMDEREQTLTCATWLTLLWHDEYLVWNPEEYGGLEKIKIPAETIWLPDIYFYNNAHPTYDKFLVGTIVKIKYTGDIQWAAPVNFKGQCLLDITYFPFDRQRCDMKFGPWQHDGTELVVRGAGESTVFTSNGEWDMIGLSSCNNVEYYPDDPGIPYTDVTFFINFSRRPHFYVFNLMMPSLLITLLASLAFLLPPQSQGKVNLGVTFLLSMTVFLMIVAESIPPTNTVPVIGQYFAASMLLVSMSLVLNVIVVSVFSKSNSGEPLPIWLRALVIHILAPLVRVKTGDLVKSPSSRKRHKNKGGRFFRSGREMEFERVPNDVRPSGLAFETTDVDTATKNLMDYTPNNSMDRLESIALELRRVNEILANCGHSQPGGGPPKTAEEKKNERVWVVTARVLDRVFLVLYLIGNVASVLMLVFQTLHIGQYFAASMLLVSMSLVLNVIVVTVFSKSNGGEPLPIWLRALVIHILAPLVRVKTGDLAKMKSSRKRHKNKGGRFFRSGREMEFERVPNDIRPSGLAFETTDADAATKNLMDYTPNNSMDRLESIALELRRVNEMLATIGHAPPGGGTPKTPEEKKNERAWVVTARVLDRVFLILYLIGNVLSVLMLIFQILHIGEPHGKEDLCHEG